VRQRLSSEKDRYRGRRRVPTPPRSRYAIVVTGAFVGAGVVALGASAMPDAKTVDPQVLAGLHESAGVDNALQERAQDATKASRSERTEKMETSLADSPDVWQLPLSGYTFTTPYGMQGTELHAGIDLVAPEGAPFSAVHEGVVKEAGWIGGYGMAVIIDNGDGSEVIYAHARQILVQKGQQVKAGDMIGLVGSTGHARGPQLTIETQVNGESTDPIPFFKERGVDIQLQVESIFG
jgi:murein DD-endopeptidase MepM/ murein hydrolase activator NlpD